MLISRRQFLKYCTVAAGAIGLTATDLMRLEKALALSNGLSVLWIAGQACTGCTTSLANSVQYATIQDLLLSGPSTAYGTIELKVCETLMASMDVQATQQANLTTEPFALVIEGAIPAAGYCEIGSYTGAASEDVGAVITALATHANCAAVLAVGACASYGGVPASKPYPTAAKGILDCLPSVTAKTICLPGCPPNPNWIVGTIAGILTGLANSGTVQLPNLDNIRRPKTYYGARVCNNCYRYPQAGTKQFIQPRPSSINDTFNHQLSQSGKNGPDVPNATSWCLRRAGCKGMKTQADCPVRKWNSPGFGQIGVNWCVGAGAPCQGCVQKGFPDYFSPFLNLS